MTILQTVQGASDLLERSRAANDFLLMFWIIGADGAAKALAEMLSGMGTIPSAAGNIIGGQFEHAEWEGLRFYDLIFPLFIFVTGVAIVFSLTRLVEQESRSNAHWRVLRRSLLLFALGQV